MSNMDNIKHLIEMHVSDIDSFEELSKSFLVHKTNADGKHVRIMISKDAVLGGTQGQCFSCHKPVLLRMIHDKWVKFNHEDNSIHMDEDSSSGRQAHEHSGYTVECWECGIPFCRRCMGSEGNMSDQYCGC